MTNQLQMVEDGQKFKVDVFLWAIANSSSEFILLSRKLIIKNLNITDGSLDKTSDDLNNGGLAGSVMSQDWDDAFLFDRKRDVLQCLNLSEVLRDVLDLDSIVEPVIF